MSREILAFGLCAGLSFLATVVAWLVPASPGGPPLMVAVSLTGLIAIFTSAMIYVDTRRQFWNPQLVLGKFYGTMLLLGTAGTVTFAAWLGANSLARTLSLVVLVIQAVLLFWEMSGWAPKYLPPSIVRDMRGRLQDKMMFGSDYPSIPYPRLFKEWEELGFSDAFLEKFYHGNAERVLGL